MEVQSPRKSERSNKGVPPKRFVDMEEVLGKNSVPAGSAATNNTAVSSPGQPGGSKSDSRTSQADFARIVADMQKEMMRQIGAVNKNLQNLIVAQKEQTAASIASLHQEIQMVSQNAAL